MRNDDIYLGKTLLLQDSRRDTYNFLLKKYQSKLKGWKEKLLSHAGKTTLIKLVLASIPSYHMATNLIPKSTCKDINKMQRDFWWGKEEGKGKIYLKSWSTFQKAKDNEGLGIKEMEAVNNALKAKLGWRFIKKSL